jgi:spore coat protein A
MYHCHILEHEDRDMMRPIVIMPMELGPFMA